MQFAFCFCQCFFFVKKDLTLTLSSLLHPITFDLVILQKKRLSFYKKKATKKGYKKGCLEKRISPFDSKEMKSSKKKIKKKNLFEGRINKLERKREITKTRKKCRSNTLRSVWDVWMGVV